MSGGGVAEGAPPRPAPPGASSGERGEDASAEGGAEPDSANTGPRPRRSPPGGGREGDAPLRPSLRGEPRDARTARLREALGRRLGSIVVVCETVRRRHNVSAILRSCEAFGIHEVHLVTGGFSRPSRGAARGAERWVARRTFATLDESVAELRARGFRIVIADLRPGAWSPEEVPVDGPLALVLGSELLGVSDRARALADGAVCIPMHGLTGSLNVSASAAILVRALGERRRAVAGADLDPSVQAACLADWLAREAAAEEGRVARVSPVHPDDPGAGLLVED
ncbi:MAG: hypothetical protein RLZZ299_697 [Pseudomonadota bacterium]